MGDVTPYPGALAATYSPPAPLTPAFHVNDFDCGKIPLDDWLKFRALKAEGSTARSYVVATRNVVVGYYCISTGGVQRDTGLPRKLRQNMPDHIPLVVLGRLAVDKNHHGKGIGRGLMKDALLRIATASSVVGVRAVLVHAIDQQAVPFYLQYGFRQFPMENLTLFLPIEEVIAAL